jgi:hypothetical protein
LAVAVRASPSLVPVMVSVNVPLGPDLDVPTLSVEVLVVEDGLKVTVEPDGWPLRLRLTEPEKPLIAVTVTV